MEGSLDRLAEEGVKLGSVGHFVGGFGVEHRENALRQSACGPTMGEHDASVLLPLLTPCLRNTFEIPSIVSQQHPITERTTKHEARYRPPTIGS
jgi:hypothetical protein